MKRKLTCVERNCGWYLTTVELRKVVAHAEKERNEAHDLVIDLFAQAAWVDCTADEEYPLSDMALSALEDAAQYLLQHNEIQQHPSGRRRYRLTPKIEVSSGS